MVYGCIVHIMSGCLRNKPQFNPYGNFEEFQGFGGHVHICFLVKFSGIAQLGKYIKRGSYFVPTSLLNRGRVLFRLLCLCLLFILENSEMEHVCLFLSIAAQSLNLRIFPPNILKDSGMIQVPKMEVLGWGFPYISLAYSLHR